MSVPAIIALVWILLAVYVLAMPMWLEHKHKRIEGEYWTGRNDNTIPSAKHATLRDAEHWIAVQQQLDPEGVERGEYYLDGPHD